MKRSAAAAAAAAAAVVSAAKKQEDEQTRSNADTEYLAHQIVDNANDGSHPPAHQQFELPGSCVGPEQFTNHPDNATSAEMSLAIQQQQEEMQRTFLMMAQSQAAESEIPQIAQLVGSQGGGDGSGAGAGSDAMDNSNITMEQLLQQMMGGDQSLSELAAAAQAAIASRPTEHFINAAQNGSIIGSTETITGLLPNSLLMTSIFDGVHPDDRKGFEAIKKYFWDKGNIDVEAYFRRKTAEGEWIWLVAKVASINENPIPGFILHEYRSEDDDAASMFNRLIWLTASLAEGLEEAEEWKPTDNAEVETDSNSSQSFDSLMTSAIPGLADDAVKLKHFLSQVANGSMQTDQFGSQNLLQNLVDAATQGGAIPQDAPPSGVTKNDTKRNSRSTTKTQKTVDDQSLLDLVSSGPTVNISKVELSQTELLITVLVLNRQLTIDELVSLITGNKTSPERIKTLVNSYPLGSLSSESEKRKEKSKHSEGRHSKDLRTPRRLSFNPKSPSSYTTKRSWSSRTIRNERGQNEPMQSSNNFAKSKSHSLHESLQTSSSLAPPHISTITLSCCRIGSAGLTMLSDILHTSTPFLKMLDLSFCNIEEKGFLAMCRALRKRRKNNLPSLKGLILSGNVISYKAGKELGLSLSKRDTRIRAQILRHEKVLEGYNEDCEDDEEDDEDVGEKKEVSSRSDKCRQGIQILHLGSTSLLADTLVQLMIGLGEDCDLQELNVTSNNIGAEGTAQIVKFLEGGMLGRESKQRKKKTVIMPKLDRLDLSNNNLGDNGTAKIARVISRRRERNIVDLHLSFNEMGSGGTGTIMNKLLQHNLVSLSLDNNIIGDAGCQLVAGSLTSMHHLSKLNLSFNQIGSRGITSLMRALIGCESITYLGLSGNVMKITGAIAMGFALAQHPRLSHLDLDNCCLSQVSQCHIVAGIISNRWVPMQKLYGFQVAPPMVAIGALNVFSQNLKNTECFSSRRNTQMKTYLQRMETNREAKLSGNAVIDDSNNENEGSFLSADFISNMDDGNSAPSQNAYVRIIDWLSKIPFDGDELNDLRRYFYDSDDGGDGLRGSDGNINLKHRGDLLAALGSGMAEKIRRNDVEFPDGPAVGFGIDADDSDEDDSFECVWNSSKLTINYTNGYNDELNKSDDESASIRESSTKRRKTDHNGTRSSASSFSLGSKASMPRTESSKSTNSQGESKSQKCLKARITMFPQFLNKLELLKASAQEMMDNETDRDQQDIVAQQFAEASLTLLRQLRYHCMNSGLDGWRQGKIRRKVLVVDDSPITRKLVARAFKKANFVVDTAENGEEGVQMMKESIYDIAFMDIDMPVMNGFDATKALREWEDQKRPGARQPICALTAAYVDDFEREELMKFKEAGLDVMESKPCNIPRLFKVVDDVSPMFSDLSITVTQQLDRASALG